MKRKEKMERVDNNKPGLYWLAINLGYKDMNHLPEQKGYKSIRELARNYGFRGMYQFMQNKEFYARLDSLRLSRG